MTSTGTFCGGGARDHQAGPGPPRRSWRHYANVVPSHAAALRRAVRPTALPWTGWRTSTPRVPRRASHAWRPEAAGPQQRRCWRAGLGRRGKDRPACRHALAGPPTPGVYGGAVCTGELRGHRLLEGTLPTSEGRGPGIGAATCAWAKPRVVTRFELARASWRSTPPLSLAGRLAPGVPEPAGRRRVKLAAGPAGSKSFCRRARRLDLGAAGKRSHPDGPVQVLRPPTADGYGRGEGLRRRAVSSRPPDGRDVTGRRPGAPRDPWRLAAGQGQAGNTGRDHGFPGGEAQASPRNCLASPCQQRAGARSSAHRVDYVEGAALRAHGEPRWADPLGGGPRLAACYGAGRGPPGRPLLLNRARLTVQHRPPWRRRPGGHSRGR